MALNSYARLTLNGAAISGGVSTDQIGGIDVGSDHIELMRVSFGAETAREAASARATGRRQYQPLRFIKRIDRSTPVLYRALAQNEVVEGEILLFAINPGDGTVSNFFTVDVAQARVSAITSVSPDSLDPSVATREAYEEVALTFASITLTSEDGGVAFQDQINRNV